MSIGSCLLANQPTGLGEAMIQRRIEGKSWKEIADEFSLPNPSAARKAFQKATGITDFKVKGKLLADAVSDMSAKAAQTGIFAAKNAVKIVDTALEEAPAFIAQAVTPKWKTIENIADEVGLSIDDATKIVNFNLQGNGYLGIKQKLAGQGVEVGFEQIDRVVWNSLMAKNEGKTWKAYLEKPTSQEGFGAVKTKILDLKAKGLSVDDIVKIAESPPESVVNAIINDKWSLPTPGSTSPVIPPPPPAPPQVFTGNVKATTGTNFRRHTDDEMMSWIDNAPPLSRDARSAVSNYTGSGYHSINGNLRGTVGSDYYGGGEAVTNTVKSLDKAMQPIPFDTTVTRNISGTEAFGGIDPTSLPGTIFRDKAYLSTSIKESGVFGGNVQMIINVPKGAKARYVRDISHHKSEYELLLARDTRIVITKVELQQSGGYYGNKYIVYGEVIV